MCSLFFYCLVAEPEEDNLIKSSVTDTDDNDEDADATRELYNYKPSNNAAKLPDIFLSKHKVRSFLEGEFRFQYKPLDNTSG